MYLLGFVILILAFATSSVSITIARSKAMEPMRDWVASKNKVLGHLVNCPYCVSHWAAFFFTLMYFGGDSVFASSLVIISIFATIGVSALIIGAAMSLLHMTERHIEDLTDEVERLTVENVNFRLTLSKIADDHAKK